MPQGEKHLHFGELFVFHIISFLMLQHTVQPLIKQRCQVYFDRCFMEWKKRKANFFFFFLFSVGGPLRPLSLCLLSDERLMECCSARPEPTQCMQKVTETALVY